MSFPLSDFEQHIDKGILQKGRNYWEQDLVDDLKRKADGQIKARVYGTEAYRVKIWVENNQVTAQTCSCPYDWGPVCKHVVAVLYSVQAEKAGTPASSAPRKKRKQKNASPKQQVEQILEALSLEEIKDLVRELCESRDLRPVIITRYAYLLEQNSPETYLKILRSAANSAAGRYGFIEYGNEEILIEPAENLLMQAEKYLRTANYLQTINICQAIVEVMAETIEQADDSDGQIGSIIEEAFALLNKIAETKLPQRLQEDLFSDCLDQASKEKYAGWDWKWIWYQLAGDLVADSDQEAQLTQQLEREISKKGDDWSAGYNRERAARIQLKLLQRRDPALAQTYLQTHVQFSSFRKQLLEQAYDAGAYDEVLQLAAEGIAQDTEYAGLVSDWKQWQLKAYEAQGNTDALISQAENLFFRGRYEMHYFRTIKTHTPPEAWESTREALIGKMITHTRWKPVEALAAVFIEEGLPARLMALLQESPHLQNISRYEAHLKDHFPVELRELYRTAIYRLLEGTTGRSVYQQASKIMRSMKKWGGEEIVQEMVQHLKTTYSRRPALLDELKRI